MKYLHFPLSRYFFVLLLPVLLLVTLYVDSGFAATKNTETFDIIYLRTKDFEKILDYKEELETVFDAQVLKKLKIVGWDNGEYGLLYDGNLSARTVSKTLIKHADMLSKTGFNEPFATRGKEFHTLYNVSYGMGPNLDSLKEKYRILYSCLGEEVKRDLFIEKSDYGNYLLVYRLRSDEASTAAVAKKHAALLRSQKISTALTKENSNTVVYGESSLIDDGELVVTQTLTDKTRPDLTKSKNPPTAIETKGNVQQAEPQTTQKQGITTPAKSEVAVSANKKSQPDNTAAISSEDTKVERIITEYIHSLRDKGVIDKDESTGWMVYDLESDKNLVGINSEIEFQAASMIKPFIALAFFHQVREGKLQYDKQSRRQMEAMIQRSSNSATNYIMRRAGGPEQCNAILKKHYSDIFKKTVIKEYIPAGGRTYLNSATPADYVRFLRSLWNMDLPYGKEIRRVMALPGRDRLYYGTNIPRGTLVYNKTGSTARLCGDMGILVTKTRKGDIYPYAIVGIIERSSSATDYGQWMASRSRVIREVSTLVYEGLKKEHQLL